jgi:hypothetical protein
MLMPKASVDKHSLFQFRENNIRMARQTLAMKAVPITQSVQKAPNLKLRRHAFAADLPHILASSFR